MKMLAPLFRHVQGPSNRAPALGALLVCAIAASVTGCDPAPDVGAVDATTVETDTTPGEDTVTPPEDTVTPPEDTVTPPEDTVAPPEDAVIPPNDTVTPPNDTVTPPEDVTAPNDTTDPNNPVLPATRPAVASSHTTTLTPFTLAPGAETTRCVVQRLDNPGILWVSDVAATLARGSHHLIIYKSDETVERTTPFECDPFVETLKGETFPIMITQIRNETLSFPNGVAFRFEPHQMIRLEAHYLNYFTEQIEATASIRFDGIREEDKVSEANMLFYGNPDFRLPAQSTFSTPWRYLSVLPGMRVFALTGHTHAFGTNVEVEYATSVETPGESVYPETDEPYLWDEPPVTRYEPPLQFAGQEGFRYRCSWDNTSNRAVSFGESAGKEMCFFWAYYYPSQGYRICISPGSIGDGVAGDEMCCPGHWACDYISSQL